MNNFDMGGLSRCLREITHIEMQCLVSKLNGLGSHKLEKLIADKASQTLILGEVFVKNNNLQGSAKAFENAAHQYDRPLQDNSAVCEIFHRLFVDLIDDLKDMPFLRVNTDRIGFVDANHLFGTGVRDSFPSASRDIKEAGNCLAAECPTASVFHLMRAAEVALRCVANDRQVSFAIKSLNQQEWGTILGALEGILKQMRLDDGKKWQKPEFKEAQIQFYNDSIQELRAFNEAWRRHVAHADADAFYDRDDAANIMRHVWYFMDKLSKRISENKTMPLYWDTE